MDRITCLEDWKSLLDSIESTDNKINGESLKELAKILDHLPPQVPIRQQKDFNLCAQRSEKLLGDLFDKIDLSDKSLLCNLLQAHESFGYFRISQITYSSDLVPTYDDPSSNLNASGSLFAIVKTKWYDLKPILPDAGTIGWKSILNHGIVKDEKSQDGIILLHMCLKLLKQKLHFHSILLTLDDYVEYSSVIRKNGSKVAEKLFELIRDVAYDEKSVTGIDSWIYNLIKPFVDQENQVAIIDAIVEDLFKPFIVQKEPVEEAKNKIMDLVQGLIMNQQSTQELFTAKLIEHMRVNVLRRHKRRHSTELNEDGQTTISMETLLDQINQGAKLSSLLDDSIHVKEFLTTNLKYFQIGYVNYWIKVVIQIIPQKALTMTSAMAIVNTCFVILNTACLVTNETQESSVIDLTRNACTLIAQAIVNTSQYRLDRLFKSLDPLQLIDLTKRLTNDNDNLVLMNFEPSVQKIYQAYLNRYLRWCLMKQALSEAEKLKEFCEFISRHKECNKNACRSLQYMCSQEFNSCFEDLKGRGNNKVMEIYLTCSKLCSKKLYKFIKKYLRHSTESTGDTEDESENHNSSSTSVDASHRRNIVLHALVMTLCTAIKRQDNETLDTYGDLVLKVYNMLYVRVEKLVKIAESGQKGSFDAIDPYLGKLATLYLHNKDMIKVYLDYDLIDSLSQLISPTESDEENSPPEDQSKCEKVLYKDLKSKLSSLKERESDDVYHGIINKQYQSIIGQNFLSTDDVKTELICCGGYLDQMRVLGEVYRIILGHCPVSVYKKVLRRTVEKFSTCDPLNHPNFLYLILILESLIDRNNPFSTDVQESLKSSLPTLTCSLIKVCKSVEFGPSIHAFTKSGSHKSSLAIQCCTYSSCIKIYTQIFLKYPPEMTTELITDAMQMSISANLMRYSKYTDRMHRLFIRLASSISGLLKSILMHRKDNDSLENSMPIIFSVLSQLIRCLVLASDRLKLEDMSRPTNGFGDDSNHSNHNAKISHGEKVNKSYEHQLELLARDISKALNYLSSLKVKLVEFAPHLIAEYIRDIQRASCPDNVRIHLDEGVFRIFNLVDAHQTERQSAIIEAGIQRKTVAGRAKGSLFEMIHSRLDQASREIFRDLHDNYNKFHRYVGKR